MSEERIRIKMRGGDEKMIIRKTIYSHELVESELLDVLPVGRGEKTSPLAHLPYIPSDDSQVQFLIEN